MYCTTQSIGKSIIDNVYALVMVWSRDTKIVLEMTNIVLKKNCKNKKEQKNYWMWLLLIVQFINLTLLNVLILQVLSVTVG